MGEMTWEELKAQAARLDDLNAKERAAQEKVDVTETAWKTAVKARDEVQRDLWAAQSAHTLVDMAERAGLTDVEVRPWSSWANGSDIYKRMCLVARQSGLPVLVVAGVVPARRAELVGPGPAVEGRVRGGRKWYAPSDLPKFAEVAEWRLVEVSRG